MKESVLTSLLRCSAAVEPSLVALLFLGWRRRRRRHRHHPA